MLQLFFLFYFLCIKYAEQSPIPNVSSTDVYESTVSIVSPPRNATSTQPSTTTSHPQTLEDILLNGKSTFTRESLASFIRGMDKLNQIQAKLFDANATDIPEFGDLKNHLVYANITRPDLLPYLFQGDIILTEDQLQEIIRYLFLKYSTNFSYAEFELYKKEHMCNTTIQNRKKRTLTSSLSLRWRSFPIRYMISSGVDTSAIAAGLKLWTDNTCITFQQVSSLSGNMLQYIYGSGCYSNIGMLGGVQQISIGDGCNVNGIVAHETGHALGYYHEHARFDRDSYVDILTQNIPSQYLSQFSKVSPSAMITYGVQYDLGSVMHYDPFSFTSNGQPTIETADPNYQDTIGQRVGLSFNDIKKMNFAYCNNTCLSKLNCLNSGYTDPKNCSQCRCPEGLGGTFCVQAADSGYPCGTTNLQATSSLLSLSVSGYGICYYLISAPAGKRVLVNVQSINFNPSTPCDTTYLEVKFKQDLGNTGPRFCDTVANKSIYTEGNQAILIYKGGSSTQRFSITYRYDPPNLADLVATKPSAALPPLSVKQEDLSQNTTTTQPTTHQATTLPVQPEAPDNNLAWSSCTASCGGCGIQVQFLNGMTHAVRYCNTSPCPGNFSIGPFCCQPFFYTTQSNSCLRVQDESKVTVPPSDWTFALSDRSDSLPKASSKIPPFWVTNTQKFRKSEDKDEIMVTSKPVTILDELVAIDKEFHMI